MTKQEDIRKSLIEFFTPPNDTHKGEPILHENIGATVDALLFHLHSRGDIVVKVDDPNFIPVAFRIAVEPLIKEVENGK